MRVKVWGVLIVVLLALVAVADCVGPYVLERVVAERIQTAMATPTRPSVDISGFPFLTQLVRGRLSEVEVEIRDGDAGRVVVERVNARLEGVRRLGDGIEVEAIEGKGLLTYADLSAAVRPLQVGYGGEDLVAITAMVRVAGRELTASAAGRPRIKGNQLIVKPERASTNAAAVPASRLLGRIPKIRVLLRDIPPNLDIDLDPTETGVEFTFSGRNVFLRSADTTA